MSESECIPCCNRTAQVIGKGLPASPGAAVGQAVFSPEAAEEFAAAGQPCILVRLETSPEDVGGMHAAQGVLTARGGTCVGAKAALLCVRACVHACVHFYFFSNPSSAPGSVARQRHAQCKSCRWHTRLWSQAEHVVANVKARRRTCAAVAASAQIVRGPLLSKLQTMSANCK